MRQIKHLEPDIHLQQRLTRWSRYCAVFVLIIAVLVLGGWKWGMNPLTALSFVLTALSLLLLSPSKSIFPKKAFPGRKDLVAGRVMAVLLLLVGFLKIAARIGIIRFPVDLFLFSENGISNNPAGLPGPMTLSATCCFILTGASLLLMNTETKARRMPTHYMAVAIGLLGLFSLVGSLYRVQAFYGPLRFTPMATPTSVCFMFISIALLFANPGKGIMKEFTCTYTGGLMARRLLPLTILLPVILGYLRLIGYWRGLFSAEFGATILVVNIVFLFILIIWINTYLLNKRDALKRESEINMLVSEERCLLLINSVKDHAIFMLDPSGTIISWNKGAERAKGYTADEIIGKHISVFYTKDEISRKEPEHNLDKARKEGRFEREGWRVRKDGSTFWGDIIITALYNPEGELMGFAKVTRDITERKKAEDQIAYMARLMEDTGDAIFSTDRSFIIRTWNKAAELLFGYCLAEVKGKSAGGILRAQLEEDIRQSIQKELIEGGYWKGEVHYLKKNDSVLTIFLSASGVRNEAGELDGFVMVCRDFTERKKLELQLQLFNKDLERQVKNKTAELTGIFERITDAFIATDKNLCYTYLNKKAGELIHHDPSSLIGKWVWDIFPDAIGSSTYLAFNKAMAEQKNMTNIDYYPPLDLWQENHLYPSPEGLSVFIRDITEQKRTDKEITDYKYALDQSSIVSITDPRGKIRYVNDNFCRISKYASGELIGRNHKIIGSDFHSAAFIERLWLTISSGKVWNGEFCNRAKDGSIYWVDMTIVPFLDEKNEPYEYMALDNDITERKKGEELLQRSYEEIRQLASHLQDVREEERAGIAREIHDELGQQLTGIKMDLSWISKRLPIQEENEIRQKVNGTLGLLDTTIKTVRRIATELRPSILDDLGLIAAIEWQSNEFQKRSGIPTEFISSLPEFKGSSAVAIGLFRICQESLTNIARHAEAGKVCITLQETGNNGILLRIADNGKGFQPDRIGPAKTLGLLGMKERALMMGGDFAVSSQPGQGTVLSVTVPLKH